MRAALDRLGATRRELTLARALEDGERLRFEQGDSQLLVVNLREQQTAEARLREVDVLLDYQRALAGLKAARGEGFSANGRRAAEGTKGSRPTPPARSADVCSTSRAWRLRASSTCLCGGCNRGQYSNSRAQSDP